MGMVCLGEHKPIVHLSAVTFVVPEGLYLGVPLYSSSSPLYTLEIVGDNS